MTKIANINSELVLPAAEAKVPVGLPDGIYPNLPAAIYHADPALSASGIKDLLVSPLTYWVRSALNKDKEPDEDTPAQAFGEASHKRIVEGAAAFHAAYAVWPSVTDHPGALATVDDIKGRLRDLALPLSGNKPDLIERLRAADPESVFWEDITTAFEADNQHKKRASKDMFEDIERRAKLIEADPAVRGAFTGGMPEVSIFWRAGDGTRRKIRMDYLRPGFVVDLKTFSNPFNKPVDTAIAHTTANYRHGIQARWYCEGYAAGHDLVRRFGKDSFKGEASVADDWVAAFKSKPAARFFFVFVESGKVPNVRVRELGPKNQDGTESLTWNAAGSLINQSLIDYHNYMATFGPDKPWAPPSASRLFNDEEFPMWSLDT